jgi:serine/threonine protein kinase
LITGRYRLHDRIGSGAMGVVWRAVDERLHRTVAVKQLLLQPGYTDEETEEARQRSMREGRIAARLQHQNAIAIFDVAEDDGHPVLVMEYLPSESLASVLVERGTLPPLEVARIGAQIAGALAAAHLAGIVHRDLKPGNVLLGDNGEAKITDFGISRAIGDVAVTKSGILAGTPAYLSPEVALGRDPAPASDVFSLGATLYAAIEGEPPFGVDENAISLLHRVARGQAEPPRQAGPMTGPLMQLLRADPVDRPTMAQAREMLQAVVDGRPTPGGAPPPPPPPRQQPRAAVAPTPARESGGTRVGLPSHAPTPPPPAPESSSERRGKSRSVLIWAVALILAILVGVLGANYFASGKNDPSQSQSAGQQPQPQPSPASPPPSPAPATTAATTVAATSSPVPSSTASSAAQPTPQEMEAVVRQYFSLVPEHLDEGWQLLGPGLQKQGKERYERFWKSIDDVQIIAGPQAAGSSVGLILQYTRNDRKITEKHLLGMVVKDGKPLINTDQRA